MATMDGSRRSTDESSPTPYRRLHRTVTRPTDPLDPDTDTPADTDDEPRTDTTPDPTPDRGTTTRRLPTFGLSGIQLVGTALAATTATVAASFLGVTGTVIGAALASVVTAIGNAVYTTSLRSTRDRVRDVVPLPARNTRSLPVVRDQPPTLPGRTPRPRPRPQGPGPAGRTVWKRAAIGGLSVFVVLMAVVTSVEVLAGRPISDVVRGDSGGGTSFFGHDTVTTKTVPPTVPPAPTVYVTVTPKVVVTTPTVTQTAPAATSTAPAATTGTPTPATSTTPTATPSAAGSSTP